MSLGKATLAVLLAAGVGLALHRRRTRSKKPADSKVAPIAEPTGLESLEQIDPEIFDLVQREQTRQWRGIELIASENFTSKAVMEALGTCLTNKYSEGYPGRRYYGGNEYIDHIETLCIERALHAFNLDSKVWGVNVQPYSGSPCNFAVYTAVLNPRDRVMGLDLPSGGHLTHGYYTEKRKVSATSIFFESLPYKVNEQTGLIDYDAMEKVAEVFRPRMIISGASAYPREWDYKRLRVIADKVGAILMCDMAHISGLVASQVVANPFDHCDIVTTTTHKSLRGPRAGMIFFRKDGKNSELEAKINFAVFPSVQGGPHNNTIAAIAVQLKEVATPHFKAYSVQVRKNAAALAKALVDRGYTLATNGTDNHLILWNLRPQNLTGSKMQAICDAVSITLNKNSIVGDKSADTPGGVRVGTPAMTTRGLKESDFEIVAAFLDRAVKLALDIQVGTGKLLEPFKKACATHPGVVALRRDVEVFSKRFAMPGFETSSMRYHE